MPSGCVGAVITTMRRKAPELEEAKLRIEALEEKVDASQKEVAHMKLECESKVSAMTSSMTAEREVLTARLEEARLQIEALEKKQKDLGKELSQEAQKSSKASEELEEARALVGTLEAELDTLQKELARNKMESKSELSSMRQTLSRVSVELESAQTEKAKILKELEMGREAEAKAAKLQAELDALRKEFKECAVVAARCEATQTELQDMRRRAENLVVERDSAVAQHGEALREVRILKEEQESLVVERDSAVAQQGEALRQVDILKEEKEALQTNVTAKKQKRKESFKVLTRNLSDISAQLDSAQTSWTPRKQIGSTQKTLDSLWQDLAGEESEDDFLRGG